MVLGAVFKVDYGILKCFEQIRRFFPRFVLGQYWYNIRIRVKI